MTAAAVTRIPSLPALPSWLHSLIGGVLLLLAWQLIVSFVGSGNGTIPSPLAIVQQFWADGPLFYTVSALHTLKAAALGWLWGNALAIGLAMIALAVPVLAGPVFQLGVVSFCLPIVAIGPVLTIVFTGDIPRITLAAMAVFFTTLIGAMMGLRSADATTLDLVHAFGGKRRDQLLKVRLLSALPSLFSALRIAAPSAVLGSIIGEFLGSENGIGVILINSQQALNFSRTWAITIFATGVAGLAFGLTGLVARLLTPWAREIPANLAAGVAAISIARVENRALRIGLMIASGLFSFLVVIVAWWALLKAFDVSTFIGKGPFDVWAYLTDPDTGGDNRAAMAAEALISIRDASIGLVAGSSAAVLAAIGFTVWPAVERTFIGPALALQSVPLIAVTPLIVLLFGRSLLAIAVIGGIVAFFPTLVNVSLALKRTPKQSMDLAYVYGGSRLAMLLKVQLPIALPALFASLRIAAPLSMTGAMLAEWLATGQGIGYAILNASAVSDYDGLWARVALVTAFSLTIYKLIGLAEQWILGRLGALPG